MVNADFRRKFLYNFILKFERKRGNFVLVLLIDTVLMMVGGEYSFSNNNQDYNYSIEIVEKESIPTKSSSFAMNCNQTI